MDQAQRSGQLKTGRESETTHEECDVIADGAQAGRVDSRARHDRMERRVA